MEEILEELDPNGHELFAPHKALLSDADWAFICDYTRERMRSAIQIGAMARAFVETAQQLGATDDRGAQHFLRSKAWIHNFGVTASADEYFCALSAICGNRLGRASDALVEIAQDRMFETLDEEYQRLLAAEH